MTKTKMAYYYRDVSPEPAHDITHNRLMTPPIDALDALVMMSPSPEDLYDREGTLPVPHAQAYYLREVTPLPADDDRERTLPILSIEEYEAILVAEDMAKIILSLSVPKKSMPKGKPKNKAPAAHSYMLRSRR